jgi:hypothetical protein
LEPVILRVVHIITGVIWVGSLFVVLVFVQPSAAALGPAGAPSCRSFVGADSRMSSSSTPCLPSPPGRSLYWHDLHAYPSSGDWIGSNFGAALTVGALLAISAIIIAGLVTRPTIGRLVALGKQVAQSGGTPTPVVATRIGAPQRRLVVAERWGKGSRQGLRHFPREGKEPALPLS